MRLPWPALLSTLVACSSQPAPKPVSSEPLPETRPPARSSCQPEACRAACDRGDLSACTRLADHIYPRDRAAARALYERACAKDEPSACYRMLEETGDEQYARRACAGGETGACNFMSEWSMLAWAAPRLGEDRDAMFELARQTSTRACELGSYRSCINAISLLEFQKADRAAIASLASEAMTHAEAACADGELGACSFIADWASRAGDPARELEFRARECAIKRRLRFTIVDPKGDVSGTSAGESQPKSCDRVVELGGDLEDVDRPDASSEPAGERLASQRAVEARRVSGRTQIQPNETEAAAIRAGKRPIISVFKICISERGGIATIRMLDASRFSDWNRRLFEAMTGWRYAPFTVDGRPVPVCTAITFVYKPSS